MTENSNRSSDRFAINRNGGGGGVQKFDVDKNSAPPPPLGKNALLYNSRKSSRILVEVEARSGGRWVRGGPYRRLETRLYTKTGGGGGRGVGRVIVTQGMPGVCTC